MKAPICVGCITIFLWFVGCYLPSQAHWQLGPLCHFQLRCALHGAVWSRHGIQGMWVLQRKKSLLSHRQWNLASKARSLGLCCCTARAPEWWLHLCHPYVDAGQDVEGLRTTDMDKVVQLTPVTCRCDALLHSVSTWLERFDRCLQDVAFAEVQVRLSNVFSPAVKKVFPILIGFKCFIRELVNDLNVFFWCVTSVISNIWYFNISDYDHADIVYLNSLIHSIYLSTFNIIAFIIAGSWFGTCFICPYIRNNIQSQLTNIFRGVDTTNQNIVQYLQHNWYTQLYPIVLFLSALFKAGENTYHFMKLSFPAPCSIWNTVSVDYCLINSWLLLSWRSSYSHKMRKTR